MDAKRDGFESLFDKYKGYVYTICYRYTRSKDDSLDLVQDVFIKILNNMDKIEKNKDIKAWIRKISVNTCLNHNRDKKDEFSIDEQFEGNSLKDMIAEKNLTEDIVIANITNSKLRSYIAALQPEIKMAIMLRHFDGLNYKEIAHLMKRPEGTVKTYIYKGRQELIKKLTEYEMAGGI